MADTWTPASMTRGQREARDRDGGNRVVRNCSLCHTRRDRPGFQVDYMEEEGPDIAYVLDAVFLEHVRAEHPEFLA